MAEEVPALEQVDWFSGAVRSDNNFRFLRAGYAFLAVHAAPWLGRDAALLVVNVSSDAAVGGYPGWGGYGATKAALDLVSLTLATELASRGVAVASVDPGDLRTAMHQAAFPGEDISDRPAPEETLPFWAWLLGRPREVVSGRRFRAQAEVWEVPA